MAAIGTIAVCVPALYAKKLLDSGKAAEAVSYLESHLRAKPADHTAWQCLAEAHSWGRRHSAALDAIEHAILLAPRKRTYQRLKGLILLNLGNFGGAISSLLPMVQANSGDLLAAQILQVAYSKSGKSQHAVALGRKLLKAEDANAMKITRESPSADLLQFERGSDRVISFALPDANPAAAIGAVANARLARSVYPGWRCRFYVAQSVPLAIKMALRASDADVIEASEQHADVPPALWASLAADDMSVGVILYRSCTSRVSEKEAAAVSAWLSSGKRAHVMRDHVLHRNLILPGMWGVRTDNPLFVSARVDRFMRAYGNPPQGREQRFLDSEIWPAIRDDCQIHDSYYNLFGAQLFPTMGKGTDQFHVGMGISNAAMLRKEAQSLGLSWPQTDSA